MAMDRETAFKVLVVEGFISLARRGYPVTELQIDAIRAYVDMIQEARGDSDEDVYPYEEALEALFPETPTP